MKVFFDLDGTLADFRGGLIELCGIPPLKPEEETPEYELAMWKAIHNVGNFYYRLKFMPGAKELFNTVYEALGDDCQILSSIPKPWRGVPESEQDKRDWIRDYLPDGVIANICLKEEKANYCTGKDCILIDDMEENIEAWEKSGGTGILYTDAESVRDKLDDVLASFVHYDENDFIGYRDSEGYLVLPKEWDD